MQLLIGGLMVLVVLGTGVYLLRTSAEGDIDERLEQLSEFTSEFAPDPGSEGDLQRKSATEALAGLAEDIAGRGGRSETIRAQLRRANLKLTVGEYLLMHLVTFMLAGMLGYIIWRTPILAAIAAVAGLFVPKFWVGLQRNRRLKAFDNQLADLLSMWVNALRSGYSVMQSLEAIATDAPPPASEEFRRIVLEVQIGIPFEDALDNMLLRLESEDLDMVFTAVKVQREVGGNLAEILATISHTIRERVRIKGEIRTLTAQGRITGYVISGLPIVLTLFLYAINREYVGRLFKGPPWIVEGSVPCGWPIICAGIGMITSGALIIRKIVDIDV